ncbi:hypothetical protein EJ04DRAFT_605723 [Polyplosphaeria fusca]|uniref:Uncharacterized protein n=1 Tax=Polyplosphaeria fusca TaxID=682080 RepID=A0A9P4QV53_9PLEO|nr:hypothetical protein EJ04DRAFT_605723 [Polyplosphaeria fusca]
MGITVHNVCLGAWDTELYTHHPTQSNNPFPSVVLFTYSAWVNQEVYQVPRGYVVPLHFTLFVLGNLQVLGLCIFNFCVFVFAILCTLQTAENAAALMENVTASGQPLVDMKVDYWKKVKGVMVAEIALVGVCTVVLCWFAYKHIGGSVEIRRRYLAYQVLLVLLKLEIYFVVAFILVYGLIDVHYEVPEFPLTMAMIPMLFVQVGLTIWATKHENKTLAIGAVTHRFAEVAYLLSRILALHGDGVRSCTLLKNEMLLFANVAMVLALLAGANALVCFSKCRRELKLVLLDERWNGAEYRFEPIHHQARFPERLKLD